MGRRFGKKNKVSLNWYDYNIGLIGESGVGKTTIAYEICDKYLGEDGYILLNIGKEDGVDALPNVIYEDVEDWDTFEEIIEDIVDNKEHYPNLKMIIFDTMDELVLLAQEDIIRQHNRLNPTKKTTTIKSAFGGFMAGEDMAMQQILDKIWELKSVGVNPFMIAHTKNRTKTDVVTGEEYDILTSKLTNRNFDEIKTKLDILGTAYIDRSIKTKSEKDIMGNLVTTGKIEGEKRIIAFRDNNFSVECKSRFPEIVNSIEFDPDLFVQSIKDAIKVSYSNQDGAGDFEKDKKKQEVENEVKLKEKIDQDKAEVTNEELFETFTEGFKTASAETKEEVMKFMKKNNIGVPDLQDKDNMDTDLFKELVSLL